MGRITQRDASIAATPRREKLKPCVISVSI
jgi:hypothetical protein